MAAKEAKARIKIHKLLEDSGRRFFDNATGKANMVLEPKATQMLMSYSSAYKQGAIRHGRSLNVKRSRNEKKVTRAGFQQGSALFSVLERTESD